MLVRVALLDTETTGLSPAKESILEIALILGEVDTETWAFVQTDAYESLNDPGKPIPPMATRVHGITDAMVRGQRMDQARVSQMLAATDVIVAHNAAFDRGFVTPLFPETGWKAWACTLHGIRWGSARRDLTTLLQAHGVTGGPAHRAMGDVLGLKNLLACPGPSGKPMWASLLAKFAPRKASRSLSAAPTSPNHPSPAKREAGGFQTAQEGDMEVFRAAIDTALAQGPIEVGAFVSTLLASGIQTVFAYSAPKRTLNGAGFCRVEDMAGTYTKGSAMGDAYKIARLVSRGLVIDLALDAHAEVLASNTRSALMPE